MPVLPLTAVFDDIPDPRRETANKLHALTDLLAIATCAVIGGAESWEAIAEYGRTKEAFFRRFLPLANGFPSPDTFERVFAELAPEAFARAFGRWMAGACEATGLVPIATDGKSARRAKKATATGYLTVVSAWAAENRLTLGPVAVPDGSNELGGDPRPAPDPGPGRVGRDDRRGRVPEGDGRGGPGAGRGRPASPGAG